MKQGQKQVPEYLSGKEKEQWGKIRGKGLISEGERRRGGRHLTEKGRSFGVVLLRNGRGLERGGDCSEHVCEDTFPRL